MTERSRGATPATRFLEQRGVEFATHHYEYEQHGGASHAAHCLGVPASLVVKTLVMRTDAGQRVLVLMHGDRQVSARRLASEIRARRISACSPDEALKATGYVVGGISPFGMRRPLPTYAEASIFDLPRIFVNGGRRGLLLEIEPAVLRQVQDLHEVSVAR
jgi:Cys-tRNA(Pro) deacylase